MKLKLAFFLALGLLTRLPTAKTNNIQAQDMGLSTLFYPLVGLIIGLLLYLPIFLFPNTSTYLLAAIIITLWVIVTGGLHLDGLADSADGWLGGMGDKEKTHQIMKDPLVGSAGVIAIVCLLLLKFTSVSALIQSQQGFLILFTPIIGRTLILLLFLTTPYIRQQGMASNMVNYLPKKLAWWVSAFCLICILFFSFWGVIFVLLGFLLLRNLMIKLLSGCTGDTTGASVEVGEMLFMLGSALAY